MAGQESLVIIRYEDEILLGLKKDREGKVVFGKYKWNGFGGKMDKVDNGSIEACALRETFDECGIKIPLEDLAKVGYTHYSFEGKEDDHFVTIFEYWAPDKNFKESEEMLPRWFHKKDIPYNANGLSEGCGMWPNDAIWLPMVLDGEKIEGRIHMSAKGKTLNCVINGKVYVQ